jgi:HD-like signal output (HDOD) protein
LNTLAKTLPLDACPSKASLETAFQVVRKAQIPQMPDVVLALRKEIARPDPDLKIVCDLVAKDIAITGQLLKTINSGAFNLTSRIGSVHQAVALLGMKRLENLVTAEVINRILATANGAVRVVWESILEEARATVAISRLVRSVTNDEAYLFGIMHDVGCLIFAKQSPDYTSEWILRSNTSPQLLIDYEQRSIGTAHPTVGFLLARHWQLPEHLGLAIYHHHTTGYLEGVDSKARYLIAMVKLAHYLIALSHGTHELPEMIVYRDDAWQQLEISQNDWSELCDQAMQGGWNS